MTHLAEFHEKESRLWKFLEEKNLDGVLICKRSNFSWFTCGGDNHIFLSSESGSSSLLVTHKGIFLLAAMMDGDRMLAEEVSGLGISLEKYTWVEGRDRKLADLTTALHIGCDMPTPGMQLIGESDWRDMHFPLTEWEVVRARNLGHLADAAMREVCWTIRPGDSEVRIASLLQKAYLSSGIYSDVLLVGSDERLYKYRHCLPTTKTVDKQVLMHVAGQKWGLHANLTRLVHFGPLTDELKRRHTAVSYVNAVILAHLIPGKTFMEVFEKVKLAYKEVGFADEWKGHVQGGPAAYEACYPMVLLDDNVQISTNQTFDWLQSVPGTKTEELSLLSDSGAEIISVGPGWPMLSCVVDGRSFTEPDILER